MVRGQKRYLSRCPLNTEFPLNMWFAKCRSNTISVDKYIFIYGPFDVKTLMSLQYMSFSIQYLAKKKKKYIYIYIYLYIYNMLISSI